MSQHDIDAPKSNQELMDTIMQHPYYLSLGQKNQVAYLLSLNVFYRLSDQWCLFFDKPLVNKYGMQMLNKLGMYVSRYRKDLIYDEKKHGDVDVVTYHVLRNDTLEYEEKNLLMVMYSDQKVQDWKKMARYSRTRYVKFESDRKKIRDKQLKGADKDKIESQLLESPIEMLDMAICDENIVTETKMDKNAAALLLTQVAEENIVLFDSEHTTVKGENNTWKRIYTELAVMSVDGNLLYDAQFDEINRSEVLKHLKGKIVLGKGIQAEIDYVRGYYRNYATTAQHREANKTKSKEVQCFFVDLEKFLIAKYKGYHISANELEFFRQQWLEKQECVLMKLKEDKALMRRTQIASLRIIYSWRHYFSELNGVLMNYYSNFQVVKDKLGEADFAFFRYRVITNDDYKVMLYQLLEKTKNCSLTIGCYVHNKLKCKNCSVYKLAELVKARLFPYYDLISDTVLERFFTYLCHRRDVEVGYLLENLGDILDDDNEAGLLELFSSFLAVDWENFERDKLMFMSEFS